MLEWRASAACNGQDPKIWFPEGTRMSSLRRAVAICNLCPVKEECLAHALEVKEPHGVWGGASETQRRRLLLRQRKAGMVISHSVW